MRLTTLALAMLLTATSHAQRFEIIPDDNSRTSQEYLVAVVPLADVASPATAAHEGTASYERAFKQAEDTGEPQVLLFTRGDRHAHAIAAFLSMLKASDEQLPHVIDLEQCSDKIRSEWTYDSPYAYFLVLHKKTSGHYNKGPTWASLPNVGTVERYRAWRGRNAKPRAASQRYRTYNYTPRRRSVFRSWGG